MGKDKLIDKTPIRFIAKYNRATITEYIANDIVSHQTIDVFNSLSFKHQEFMFDMAKLNVTNRSEALEQMRLKKSTVYQRLQELQALGIVSLDKKGKIFISAEVFYQFTGGELQARETQLRLQKDNSELKKENRELRRQLSNSTIDYSKLFSKTMAYEY